MEKNIVFVLDVAKALHHYGTSSYRLESAMHALCKSLALDAQFFVTPTMIMATVKSVENSYVEMLRVEPGHENLDKLCSVDELLNNLIAKNVSIEQAQNQLTQIVSKPDLYGGIVTPLGFAIISLSLNLIFGGTNYELLFSFLLGFVVGAIFERFNYSKSLNNLTELVAALFSSLFCFFLYSFFPQINPYRMLISVMIVLMPGLMLTMAIAELAMKHLASGTAKLMDALVTLLKLLFGFLLGFTLIQKVLPFHFTLSMLRGQDPPFILVFLSVLIAAFGMVICFKARMKDYMWITLASVISLLAAKTGIVYLGVAVGPFFGALVTSSASNLYARINNRPSSLMTLPGIIFLVPGSLSFQSLSFFADQETLLGIQLGIQILFQAIGIVTGLFVGNLLVNPRRYI
jgi:uncharacterized membrane protein YjjP (DUF1212 family)